MRVKNTRKSEDSLHGCSDQGLGQCDRKVLKQYTECGALAAPCTPGHGAVGAPGRGHRRARQRSEDQKLRLGGGLQPFLSALPQLIRVLWGRSLPLFLRELSYLLLGELTTGLSLESILKLFLERC